MRYLSLIFLLVISFVEASNVQKPAQEAVGQTLGSPQTLLLSVVDKEWFAGLEDESYWQLVLLEKKRPRTWSEWLHRITPTEWDLDPSFFSNPKTWVEGSYVQVYKADKSIFAGYDYVLENITTGQKAYAMLVLANRGPIPTLKYASQFLKKPLGKTTSIARKPEFLKNIIVLENNTVWKSPRTDSWGKVCSGWLRIS